MQPITVSVAAARNLGQVALVLLLVACVGFEAVKHAAYVWVALGLLGPELARLSQIPVRLAHGYWIAVALLVVSLPGPVPLAVFVVGLAWATRVAAERALVRSHPDRLEQRASRN